MAKITFHELAKAVAENTTRPLNVTEEILWDAFLSLARGLAGGDKFSFTNFGTFEPRQRAASTGRNPATGESIDVPEQMVVHFHATGALREMVRDGDVTRTIRKASPKTKKN